MFTIQAGGNIGQKMASVIVATGKHNLTAITRIGSESKLTEVVVASPVKYSNEESLVNALRCQQLLIISMSVRQDRRRCIHSRCSP